jgi:hypothetical protein
MLQWQYREILAELGELQRHGSDPTCPCVQADTGEYCLMKHALGVHTLARETASMDKAHAEMLEELAEEALDYHEALKDRIVCGKPHKDEGDVVQWARDWRKKLETIYYSCGLKEGAPTLFGMEIPPGITTGLARGLASGIGVGTGLALANWLLRGKEAKSGTPNGNGDEAEAALTGHPSDCVGGALDIPACREDWSSKGEPPKPCQDNGGEARLEGSSPLGQALMYVYGGSHV